MGRKTSRFPLKTDNQQENQDEEQRGFRGDEDGQLCLLLFCDALFLGDGVIAFENAIRERLGEKAHFAPAQHQGLRAASACALAAEYAKDEANLKDCMTLLPLYLRAPQAERERAAKEAAKAAAEGKHG